MLDNQDFIAPVTTILKKETKKAVGVELKREDRCRKFVEAAYSTGAESALSRSRPPMDISDERTKKNTHSEISKEPVLGKHYGTKRQLVISRSGPCRKRQRIECSWSQSKWTCEGLFHHRSWLRKLQPNEEVDQIWRGCGTRGAQDGKENRGADEGPHVFRKDPISVIAVLQEFKSACDVCRIYEGIVMWLFKEYLTDPVNSVVEAWAVFSNFINFFLEAALISYSAVARFLFKSYATKDNVAKTVEDTQPFSRINDTGRIYTKLMDEDTKLWVSL